MDRTSVTRIAIGVVLLIGVCASGRAQKEAAASGMTLSPGKNTLPEFAAINPEQAAATVRGQAFLAWGRKAAAEQAIPETTYTLYREFKRTGERGGYQHPYYGKRTLLAQEVMVSWLGKDDTRLDRINDLIWSICEETTWVLPAHEKGAGYIDLFAAETGTTLAHALYILGDRLPEEIQTRVRQEIKDRILDPYLENALKYSWNSGRGNWTGVCAGAVGETFLLVEQDPERLNKGVALVCEQLQRFIDNAFAPDGGSLEGVGYWNFGLSHFIIFGEMLRAVSGGSIDLVGTERLKAIARYPLTVSLAPGLFASFSDGHEEMLLDPFICARLAERTGVEGLRGLAGTGEDWCLGNVLRSLLWDPVPAAPAVALDTVLLPDSGIARLVNATPNGPTWVVAARAGHNNEPHNQNDIGSFIVCVDGVVYLCDPGAGLYCRDYFSPKRYENIFANSYGHSVPRIMGALQGTGEQYRSSIEMPDPQSARITFHAAYELPALKQAVRSIAFASGGMTLNDAFKFENGTGEVEEALVTWLPVEVSGNTARIISPKGVLEIRADQGTFAAERLEEACRANRKKEMLTRLTVVLAVAPECSARFEMTYVPKP